MPSETTVVTWDDFNFNEEDGLTVTLPEVGTADTWAKSRTVPISAWAAATLENAFQELLTGKDEILPTEPIAYRGKHAPGGHKASASASGNIGRMIAAWRTEAWPAPAPTGGESFANYAPADSKIPKPSRVSPHLTRS